MRPRAGPARNAAGLGTPSKFAPRREPGFVWAERRAELEAKNAALEEEIARLRESESEYKVEEERDELDGLMIKWRAAAQQAADELFETSKSRVQKYVSHALVCFNTAAYRISMGGMKELAAMRRRQAEFLHEELGQPARRADSDDGSVGGEVYDESEGEKVQDEEQVCISTAGKKGKLADCLQEYTVATMLRSLNIDLDVIGYDEAGDCWK